ncbi:hypothetical protein C8N35_1011381 [Breoghania corrubedonensis]|uniref:Uncharacterized protein n=1 Tax=Breoghania corrubedonensis TaxID=665038 RepID=A0A2T5VHV7_9HYPH|nr:hypothetical protein C8N35_1011381 [Breoghania corrubedonensis]
MTHGNGLTSLCVRAASGMTNGVDRDNQVPGSNIPIRVGLSD